MLAKLVSDDDNDDSDDYENDADDDVHEHFIMFRALFMYSGNPFIVTVVTAIQRVYSLQGSRKLNKNHQINRHFSRISFTPTSFQVDVVLDVESFIVVRTIAAEPQ